MAPDVGSLVDYGRDSFDRGPGKYRVDGWLRVRAAPVEPPKSDVTAHVMWEIGQEEGWHKAKRFEWCTREEATHLELSGIAGTIAPFEACTVTGVVGWTEEVLAEYRASARAKGEAHRPVF